MIHLRHVRGPADKHSRFSNRDTSATTWVVADVQSRAFLQGKELERASQVEESAIMVAGELWNALLFQSDPSYRLISDDLARSLIWEWVQPLHLSWAKTPASARRILQHMEYLAPILAVQNVEAVLEEWFRANPESLFRWRHWFEVGRRIWTEFSKRKLAVAGWVPALLIQPDWRRPIWPRRLIFDLGVRVSQIEMQLIRELGSLQDLDVVVPQPEWQQALPASLMAYRTIDEQPDQVTRPNDSRWLELPEQIHARRFATHLAEIKDATAQVRLWLEQGIAPTQIAVITPDKEVYGSSLAMYFEEEGIPLSRQAAQPLQSHPDVSRWLSEIRLRIQRFSKGDLETHLFSTDETSELNYDQFRRLFGRFYDADDIKRWPQLKVKLKQPLTKSMAQTAFLAWALDFCGKSCDWEKISSLVSEFVSAGMIEISLSVQVWVGMLEDLAARLQIESTASDRGGVQILNLGSAEWTPATHVYFLNASENVLRRWNDSPFSLAEAQRLLRDLGFAVSDHETQPSEFELCWLLHRPLEALEFSFSETNFAGDALTPSRFWLLSHRQDGHTLSPRICRWDEIQQVDTAKLAALRQWPADRGRKLEHQLNADLGLVVGGPIVSSTRTRLSASALEQLQKCPFIFAAQRVFRLTDEPMLDLDLDRMSRGRLMHRLFSEIVHEPFRANWTDDELLDLIDQARVAEEIQLAEERLWEPVRRGHLRLARQLLQMEREWRDKFPQTRTVARELAFETGWDSRNSRWHADGDIRFAGRLDRVDADAMGRYLVMDYKSSVASLRNWSSWLDGDHWQLALYSEIVEGGMTSLPAGRVDGAVYYVPKAGSRTKGYYLKEAGGELFALESTLRNQITLEQRQNLYREIHERTGLLVKKIQAGDFQPLPKDASDCDECAWSRLCRAPHLI